MDELVEEIRNKKEIAQKKSKRHDQFFVARPEPQKQKPAKPEHFEFEQGEFPELPSTSADTKPSEEDSEDKEESKETTLPEPKRIRLKKTIAARSERATRGPRCRRRHPFRAASYATSDQLR